MCCVEMNNKQKINLNMTSTSSHLSSAQISCILDPECSGVKLALRERGLLGPECSSVKLAIRERGLLDPECLGVKLALRERGLLDPED